jgi:hypothetical protein
MTAEARDFSPLSSPLHPAPNRELEIDAPIDPFRPVAPRHAP